MTNVNSGSDLSALKLPELQAHASSLGITGASKLRKGDLVTAINDNQGAGISVEGSPEASSSAPAVDSAGSDSEVPQAAPAARKRKSKSQSSAKWNDSSMLPPALSQMLRRQNSVSCGT